MLVREFQVDVNIGAANGTTALHQLVHHGSEEHVHDLLHSLNADPSRSTRGHWYPLHHAFLQNKFGLISKLWRPETDYYQAKRFFESTEQLKFQVYLDVFTVSSEASSFEACLATETLVITVGEPRVGSRG
eukprot:TRINITY_DN1604_c1_g1_i1.p2 TRINITY_DN1604_c1_g1~~TRINITY_DN1604_c1_g1_i1.p2  ORF type:complete len:131 (-),score=19.85 TRINITY_DN1604_c1_g1_i1:103-495(-)